MLCIICSFNNCDTDKLPPLGVASRGAAYEELIKGNFLDWLENAQFHIFHL